MAVAPAKKLLLTDSCVWEVATGGSSSAEGLLLQLGTPSEPSPMTRGTVLADDEGECDGEREGDGEGLCP